MDLSDMSPESRAAQKAKRILRVNQSLPFNEPLTYPEKVTGLPAQRIYANPQRVGAAGVRDMSYSRELYVPVELRAFADREGAMDAYSLQSVGTLC